MRTAPLLLVITLLSGPLAAETPITAETFEAHVTGKTITYQRAGQVFGVEEYLPGRQVRWSVAPGECLLGRWYPERQDICFVYDDDPLPSCWTFWLRDDALVALSVLAEPGAELHEVASSDVPLPCPGPDLGV